MVDRHADRKNYNQTNFQLYWLRFKRYPIVRSFIQSRLTKKNYSDKKTDNQKDIQTYIQNNIKTGTNADRMTFERKQTVIPYLGKT